jgi:hypothetical protein
LLSNQSYYGSLRDLTIKNMAPTPHQNPTQSTLILHDEDSNIEAGRMEGTREDRDNDTSMFKPNVIITDSESDTESENRREAVQKAASKQARINREMRKLHSSFNPTSMEKQAVIETDDEGKEVAKEMHFVFLAGSNH